jgi:hypothetical protein
MSTTFCLRFSLLLFVLATVPATQADTFGSGPNEFTIDFVPIGNPGNAGESNEGTFGGVSYLYRMGTYELSKASINRAAASGASNLPVVEDNNKPVGSLTWYQAAAFVNWLNTSTGHQAAYNLNGDATGMSLWSSAEAWQLGGQNLFRHKDAYYFLPSENEWYKAAYHKNDGITGNYWDYATASDAVPTAVINGTTAGTAVYNYNPVPPGPAVSPADIDNAGGLSAYGTMGQSGSLREMLEGASDRSNNTAGELRAIRGGYWQDPNPAYISSASRASASPAFGLAITGFRVASVPEPAGVALLIGPVLAWLVHRRRPIR